MIIGIALITPANPGQWRQRAFGGARETVAQSNVLSRSLESKLNAGECTAIFTSQVRSEIAFFSHSFFRGEDYVFGPQMKRFVAYYSHIE